MRKTLTPEEIARRVEQMLLMLNFHNNAASVPLHETARAKRRQQRRNGRKQNA